MYNSNYHPVNQESLGWMLRGESPEHQAIIVAKVNEATEAKTKNFFIDLPDGTNYSVLNGIVSGSCGYRG